ncbi:MAG: bile acid:sodium symporter family protein [Verrucomicrobiota bacterium]
MNVIRTATNLFALWTVLGTGWAWFFPAHFTWVVDEKLVGWGLGVIMLGMGVTLRVEDFLRVLKLPGSIGLGVACQFVIMPLCGFMLAKAFALPAELAAGLILVSCCPGGTASNVIAYLARANVPLSVLMTMTSTMLAVVLTPVLTKVYAGAIVPVDAGAMLWSMVKIVLLPVMGGVAINQVFGKGKGLEAVKAVSPLVSVVVIVLIVGAIVGKSKGAIVEAGAVLLVAVFLLHVLGFSLGYGVVRLLGYPVDFRRTVSIEVGMQNSGLGAALAKKHFSLVAAAPCAISAVYHCVIGSFLAAWWRRKSAGEAVLPADYAD